MDFDRCNRYCRAKGTFREFGGKGMETRVSPAHDKAAQWLADLHEDLDLVRYPTRVEMFRAVNEAARRAECLIRLEHAVQHLPISR